MVYFNVVYNVCVVISHIGNVSLSHVKTWTVYFQVFLHSLVVVMTTTTMQVQRAVRSPSHLEWSPS